jgi:hypothetical protein
MAMTAEDAFQTLKRFFENRNAAKQAMSAIHENVEIGIVIGGSVECALYRSGENVVVEPRPARQPDVVFHIKPETVYVLATQTKDEIGETGVNILKEVLTGNIQIKVPGRFLNIISHGYLEMIRRGGVPVSTFLARHGLSSVSKIVGTIRRMKG